MHSQRYTSTELTHFVARACKRADGEFDQDGQYDVLVKILREGRLLPPDGAGGTSFLGNGSFLKRTMIDVAAVYFCDIPISDFAIHIGKVWLFWPKLL